MDGFTCSGIGCGPILGREFESANGANDRMMRLERRMVVCSVMMKSV